MAAAALQLPRTGWAILLPGMGSGLSNVVAYASAKSGSKHPEEFGKGWNKPE